MLKHFSLIFVAAVIVCVGSEESSETTVASDSESSESSTPTTGGNKAKKECKQCQQNCIQALRCGESINGTLANKMHSILLFREGGMVDGDEVIINGGIYDNASEIHFEIYNGLTVGRIDPTFRQPTLLNFTHFYDTNVTYVTRGGVEHKSYAGVRPVILTDSIRDKSPTFGFKFKMQSSQTGLNMGDENGYFNNNISYPAVAHLQAFSLYGDWEITDISFNCNLAQKPADF
ncbi:unnamed protein product [Caenorhabditis bovis]|uniref:Galectin n=1 Tax=Caenorhabditis bovis TaxID=2654633 RepID=A0A8S1FBB1_9PELO|nr:unnamed protein product [Caenorhabditis bovis]